MTATNYEQTALEGHTNLRAPAPGDPEAPLEKTSPVPEHRDEEYRRKGRRALGAAIFGFFVDMYDVFLPAIVLAPAMVYFLPPDSDKVNTAIFFALIFVASLVGRPLGSLIFGPLGDKIGRRRTTLIAAAGSAACTGIMTFMPGYATIGIWALTLLIILRLFNGVFIGGEYSAANPLAMEYTPREKRGIAGSMINMGFPLGLAAITVVTLVTMAAVPGGGADSPYAVWGWRIPFLIGFVLCTSLFLYYLFSVPESDIWRKETGDKVNPLKELFSRKNAKSFGTAFIVGTGAWFVLNGTVSIFSGHFRALGVPDIRISTTILVSALLGALLFPLVGAAGQKHGRRQVITAIGFGCILVSSTALWLAVTFSGTAAMVPLAVLAIVPSMLIWAMITAFLMELFPTNIRASGYGVAYGLPSLIPAFYAYYMSGLGTFMSYDYTPVVIVAAGGLFIVLGGILARDRRHLELESI